jgi:hypothetical protein
MKSTVIAGLTRNPWTPGRARGDSLIVIRKSKFLESLYA